MGAAAPSNIEWPMLKIVWWLRSTISFSSGVYGEDQHTLVSLVHKLHDVLGNQLWRSITHVLAHADMWLAILRRQLLLHEVLVQIVCYSFQKKFCGTGIIVLSDTALIKLGNGENLRHPCTHHVRTSVLHMACWNGHCAADNSFSASSY